MPNRIIHEKALRSHTLAKLSPEAERLFWRLTVKADDQGRFDAYPQTVKSDCFPRIVDQVKTKDVTDWLVELSKDCIKLYAVEDRVYGYFVNWKEYQRVYGNKAKFPEPPADCGNSPRDPALILIPILNSISTSITTSITTSTPIAVDEGFELFWKEYPGERRAGKKAARKAWDTAKDKPAIDVIIAALRRAKETEQWQKDNGQFIPMPTTWLNQGRWDDEYVPKKKSLAQSFLERGGNHDGSRAVLQGVDDAHYATVGQDIPRAKRFD